MWWLREMAWWWRCAGAVLLAALLALSAASEQQSQLAPAPFILGSRFGRSPPRLLSPRNDKFFLSSRYGKRSEPPLLLPALPSPPSLACEYTGVAALYRCRPHHEHRRPWGDSSVEDE